MRGCKLSAFLGCILAIGVARAQLRSDLIESERAEKETRLTPERPPKAERRLVWVENSLAFKLLSGEVDGLGVSVGPIASGNGFALGPMYRRTDLLDGRLTLKVAARISVKQSYLGRLDIGLPSLFGGRVFTDFSAVHR